MNIYYKISLIIILFYTFYVMKQTENYRNSQNFSLPKVKVQRLSQKQKDANDEAAKFSIKKTIETGIGVHDRIRYKGDWD